MDARSNAPRPWIWLLAWDEYWGAHINLRASALAFQTLAAWLPLMAIALAAFSGEVFKTQREAILDRLTAAMVPPAPIGVRGGETGPTLLPDLALPGAPKDLTELPHEQFKEKCRATLQQMSGSLGKISTFSFIIFILIAGMLYRTCESTYNAIWKVPEGRSIFMKIAVLTALIFWGPLLFVISVAITQYFASASFLNSFFVPVGLTAAGFTGLYMLMPNTRVRFYAAAMGGLFSAVVWELGKAGFLIYVSYAVGMSKVYGSLGLVPILFAWVYLSWNIILIGGVLAYIIQNRAQVEARWLTGRRRQALGAEQTASDAAVVASLALAAACEVARRLRAGQSGGVRRGDVARALGADSDTLELALHRLLAGGVLIRVSAQDTHDPEPRYLPAGDLAQCRMEALLRACHGPRPDPGRGPAWEAAASVLDRCAREGEDAVANVTLADLFPAAAPSTPASAVAAPAPGAVPSTT